MNVIGDRLIYAVSLAHSGGADVDPTGRLVATLLAESEKPTRLDDLEDFVRARVLLGRLFERDGRIGPPDRQNTAIWQWRWVLDVEQAARRVHQNLPASSEVYLQLGAAYERIGDVAQAEVAYDAARDAFAASHDAAGVARAGGRLQRLRRTAAPGS